MWTVYLLKSSRRNWYYVGSTNDVDRRLIEHNFGKVKSTKHHTPLAIVYLREFGSESTARAFERKIKAQRLLKEDIIRTIERQSR